MIRIHIVGPPRSGTTLMLQVVANCFRVDGYGRDEMPIYYEPTTDHAVFCSKWPFDVLHVGPYLRFMPDLWVLSMQRDPRDVVTSVHGSAKDMYFNNLREWRACRQASRRLEMHPRVVSVRYEDLVRDPEGVERTLKSRLPFLEQTRPLREYHVAARPTPELLRAMHGVRPINTDSIGAWRGHKPRLRAQMDLHGDIAADLVELGYEPDARWLEELRGVAPDNGRSLFPETVKMTPKRLLIRSKRRLAFGAAVVQHWLVRPVLGRPLYLHRDCAQNGAADGQRA